MPAFSIAEMAPAILERLHPAVTQLNRLEGRPRTRSFERSLSAEVRDALWMLTRQWQLGEFEGDDAGSPVFARFQLQASPITRYQARSPATEPLDGSMPLEATVERRPIVLTQKNRAISLDIRLLMGRQWKKLVSDLPGMAEQYLAKYPVDPPASDDADYRAHPDIEQSMQALALRRIDGGKIYEYMMADPNHRVHDGIAASAEEQVVLDGKAAKFVRWYEELFYQPDQQAGSAWDASRLEYQATCSAPTENGQKQIVATEYYQGSLDWFNFNVDPSLTEPHDAVPKPTTRSVISSPVQFDNMPNTRWWEFEDRTTNYGNVTASTTDLAKLLFLEFGLVYANDWFIIPCTVPSGTMVNVRGLVVTNVFNEHTWIDPAGSAPGDDWQRWSMFTLNKVDRVDHQVDPTLLLLPTLGTYQESKPLEEVMLIRDESANLVWGIEKTVRLPDGLSRPGLEMATEAHEFWYRRLKTPDQSASPAEETSKLQYRVMNSVPENWIPFIPSHVPNSNREIQLQRAVMPRVFNADIDHEKLELLAPTDRLVLPQTSLLREGLDAQPAKQYFVHEEEIPRSGTRLVLSFKRGRWKNGKVINWLGVTKEVGRGEGSSGLSFDQSLSL